MIITYPEKIRWEKQITDDIISDYSKNNRIKLRSTLSKIDSTHVDYKISDLCEEDLSWFSPLYKASISNKKNPQQFNVANTTLNAEHGYPYQILQLVEGGDILGGTIFSIRDEKICLAYKVFLNQWNRSELKAGPTLYADYIVTKYAKEIGKNAISHGKDRNFYGKNVSIGIASYKLSVGCHAYLPEDTEYKQINIGTLKTDTDMLILEKPMESASRIEQAYLICASQDESPWTRVTKYPNLLNVKIIQQ